MLRWMVSLLGMIAVGMLVWRLLKRQEDGGDGS